METYPAGLVKLSGPENYLVWRYEVMTALKSVNLLALLHCEVEEEENMFRGRLMLSSEPINSKCGDVTDLEQNKSRLAVFLLTSIEKDLHKKLIAPCTLQDIALINPVDLWNNVEKLYTQKK